MSAAAYRARSATELIDATFQLLRRNFGQFFTLAAMFYVPIAIIPKLLLPKDFQAGALPGSGFFIAFGVFFFLFIILSAIFQTAMFYACSDAYLGLTVDIADVLKRAVRRAGTMAGGYFLQTLSIGISFLCFIVPGFYVMLALFAVPCVIAFESTDVFDAFSRSSQLSKGLKGHIFLTLLLAIVIYAVGGIIVSVVTVLVSGGVGHVTVLSQIVSALGSSLLVPLFPLALTLCYYDARIRKEGFDIELMAQQVAATGASATKPQPA